MAIDIRLPNITASSPQSQMAQMQSYLYQMVEQLNWALSAVDAAENGDTSKVLLNGSHIDLSKPSAQETFNSIKALIIKSADIVSAYEDKMMVSFDGKYVAQSDFGTFTENKLAEMNFTPSYIMQNYYNKQEVSGIVDAAVADSLRESQAWIKSGQLDEGVYGVEVGQTTVVDDEEVFNKFARFTANGIYFYLPGSTTPVAEFTNESLSITNAVIKGNLSLGGYIVDSTNGVAFKWVGRG